MFEKNCALIVIDSQNQFVNDLPEESDGWGVVDKIAETLEIFRKTDIPIIHFREIHRKQLVDFGRELDGNEGVHCIEGTEAADFTEKTRPLDNEYFIPKRRYSGFFATDLDLLLRSLKVETIYVVGFLTDVCVHYTCVDAHQHDYHVRVIKEAVGGSSIKASEAALEAIRYLQHDSIISIEDIK